MKTYEVKILTQETFNIKAKNKDEAYLRVLEGLPSDEERGTATIEIEEVEQ